MKKITILWIMTLFFVVFVPLRAEALKLVTYVYEGEMRLGAVVDDKVIDLNRAYEALLQQQGDPRPKAMAAAIVPSNMLEFLQGEERSVEAAKEAVAFVQKESAEKLKAAGILRDLQAVKLTAPVPNPPKITNMGLNYRDHAAETSQEVPKVPLLFSAYNSALIGSGDPIIIPKGTEEPDWEAELGVVIGKRGKHISPEKAMDYIVGYLIINDVSARDWQRRTSQILIGKTPDTFKPMGPYLVTKDEIPNPHGLAIKLWVNEELRQSSNTELQVFKIWDVIAYMSDIWTLEPGDVIATGTPAGVGQARKPPIFLKPGDKVRIEISGLGVLENPVVAEEQALEKDKS